MTKMYTIVHMVGHAIFHHHTAFSPPVGVVGCLMGGSSVLVDSLWRPALGSGGARVRSGGGVWTCHSGCCRRLFKGLRRGQNRGPALTSRWYRSGSFGLSLLRCRDIV